MSPEPRVKEFKPAVISTSRSEQDEPARAAGFAAGFAAGARAAAEQAREERIRLEAEAADAQRRRDLAAAQAIAALNQAILAWNNRAMPVLEEARASVYEAALELAEAVLQRQIEPGPASARTLLERALALPIEADPSVLRLHPDDLAHVNLLIESGAVIVPSGLTLVPDQRLRPGDAITEHQDGALDARIGTALARAREALLGEDL